MNPYQKQRMQHILDGRPKKVKTPKPLRKVSEKGKLRKEDKKTLVVNDMVFYLEIWQERKHVDFETGLPLPDKPLLQFFHHLLEKSPNNETDYSQYRHCKWNIVLVSWETHDKVHNNIDNCPKIKALTEQLRKLHDEGKLKPNDN